MRDKVLEDLYDSIVRIHETGNINIINFLGDTALHMALKFDKCNVAIRLIMAGINIHITNLMGFTALDFCKLYARKGDDQYKIMKLLIIMGANVNRERIEIFTGRNRHLLSPLGMYNVSADTIELLFAAGFNIGLISQSQIADVFGHGNYKNRLLLLAWRVDTKSLLQKYRIANKMDAFNNLKKIIKEYNHIELQQARDQIDDVRRSLRKIYLISRQAFQMCVGLQPLKLPSWIILQIVDEVCPLAEYVPIHLKWALVTKIRHYHEDTY